MIAGNSKLTNVQLELIKMFKYNLEESQLNELKELLSTYFANKVDAEMGNVCNEKEWSDSTIENLAQEHTRTPH